MNGWKMGVDTSCGLKIKPVRCMLLSGVLLAIWHSGCYRASGTGSDARSGDTGKSDPASDGDTVADVDGDPPSSDGSDSESGETDTNTDADGDSDTATDGDTDAATDVDTDADTDADTDGDTDADTDADVDADTDSDTDTIVDDCLAADVFDPETCPQIDPLDVKVRYVDAEVAQPGEGVSWETAFTDVQPAIDACRCVSLALGERCQVWVARGEYDVFADDMCDAVRLRPDVEVYGGFVGQETALDERDWAANRTVLNGQGRVYHVVIGWDDAAMDGLVVTGGRTGDDNLSQFNRVGSGMLNYRASPKVTNCTFEGNSARMSGGGMYNHYSSPAVTSCAFERNSAVYGAGICNFESSPAVTNCVFKENTGPSGNAIYNDFSSPVITNCTAIGLDDVVHNYGNSYVSIRNSIIWGTAPSLSDSFSGVVNEVAEIYIECPDPYEDMEYCFDTYFPSSSIADSNIGMSGGSDGWQLEFAEDLGGNIDEDPRLLDVVASHLYPRTDSPCIDAGNDELLPSDASDLDGDGNTDEEIPLDVAGAPRRNDGNGDTGATVDMGAYEFREDAMPELDPEDGLIRYVNTEVAEPGDGTSWSSAFQTVQPAVDACRWVVVVLGERCEVWVARGDYAVTETTTETATIDLRPGVAVYGGFEGDETMRDERDWEANETILDGRGISVHVVTGADGATLDGFTVTGGADVTDITGPSSGKGMYNRDCSPTVTNCAFRDNPGNGMYNADSSPAVTNCSFDGNSASGMSNMRSSPIVTNCTFEANGGSGIGNSLSSPTVTNCTFEANSQRGIYNSGGSPIVTSCTFRSNVLEGMRNSRGSAIVTSCTFESNTGGGMYNYMSSPIVTNCVFSGNTAEEGAGMYNHDAFPIVTNCRLAGNAAENQGGAIFNEDSSPIVTNCTLAGNAAEEQGGGIFNLGRSEPVFRNSIVFGNTGASFSEVANLDCFEDSCTSAPHTPNPTFENCNIGLSGGSSAWRMADATDLGGNIDADPMYADVEGDDFSLLLGSPCIDTGDDELLPEDIADLDGDGDTGERLPFDLTGSLRSTGAAPDMGAYEYQP